MDKEQLIQFIEEEVANFITTTNEIKATKLNIKRRGDNVKRPIHKSIDTHASEIDFDDAMFSRNEK